MSDDKSDKAGSWFDNPLPIVMVVLLAGGVLVKTEPLKSARPIDPERIQFVPTIQQQDVEARLWQDPFAAVEKHIKSSEQAVTLPKNTLMMLFAPTSLNTSSASPRLDELKNHIQGLNPLDDVTVVAVSVFGGPYTEDAESRRRSRFAVVSALGFHEYYPESNDAIGYFQSALSKTNGGKMPVPFEWFKKRKEDKTSHVLVLWLKDETLANTPLKILHKLSTELALTQSHPHPHPNKDGPHRHRLNVKLIGPAESTTLRDLVNEESNPQLDGGTTEVYSPSATISNCDLLDQPRWDCFENPDSLSQKTTLPIVRTIGSDDVLAASLLWELWQRGVNRDLGYVDSWWDRIWPTLKMWVGQNPTEFRRKCNDGLVLIGERDTPYGRTLMQFLTDGFSARCGTATSSPVRTFSYLRGLDGVLADHAKSVGKAPPKDDSSKSKDLRAQLDDAPPEYAEGRNQFDYLRRLADEIDRLDSHKNLAENGVRAIGIIGFDVYDKLLILQALRSRFKDKTFFTTDLDARYLHADQKDWARNLVVASNFGLSLRPALQHSTLPFRDSYQTATYLATLMALKNPPFDWTDKMKEMKEWLRPQIFEIGRTEAVHLASPSVPDLTKWVKSRYSDGTAPPAKNKECAVDLKGAVDWTQCVNIEPDRLQWSLLREHPWAISGMVCFGLLLFTLANRHVNENVRTAFCVSSPERDTAETILYLAFDAAVVVLSILAIVWNLMNDSFARGVGEPFEWFEGVSVWPSLVIRFIGLVTMLALWYAFLKMIQQQEKPDKDVEIALPKPRKLNRSKLSAWLNGPHLNLALFDQAGNAEARSAVEEKTTRKKIIDVTPLWRNYLLATSWREMAGWIVASLLIGFILFNAVFQVLDSKPSFPHRGELVKTLHFILVFSNAVVLWLTIFWVGYETRACTRFIEALSGVTNEWPDQLLARAEKEAGVPRAFLDNYLNFKLIVHATQRIHWLIYLPFVGILFMVLSRSNFFDAMDFPLPLIFVVGLALCYSLLSAFLLRRSAESARGKAIEHYETHLFLQQAPANDNQLQTMTGGDAADPSRPPINVEQIKLLIERIRNNREGAFAPFAQQPALRALLIPFGGYGSVQIIEYLVKLFGAS